VAVAALCCAALAAGAGGRDRATPESALLPDLDQEVPWDLEITRSGPGARPEFRLGFGSAVRNVGDGPLVISGRRRAAANGTMTADQIVKSRGAVLAVMARVGRLRYVRSPDHEHWHLLEFERYELRRPGRRAPLVTDRKTGFCLGDRYRARGGDLLGRAPRPVYTGRCGVGASARLRLVEGISVGYGDDYPASLEGQSLGVSGLDAGRYVFVHRVNADRLLRETNYGNNASSLLLGLRWLAGEPRARAPAVSRHGALRRPGTRPGHPPGATLE
jgi:Lysyl oxidase